MGKKQGQNQKSAQKPQPFVSVCTPTFNRRPFIETMFQCFRNQTYAKSRIEWIIIDDGTDKIGDLVAKSNIPQIQYFPIDNKMNLGAKRNYMHEKAKGSIIVYMDDDDYYPPERISHAVEMLQQNPKAMCAGASELYIFFKHINKMIQCGPYGPNHATAGTFAFRRELLMQTQYDADASLAEEKSFLKNYTIPFVQLDPMKTILVFSHEHNTFDKRKLLENPHPQYLKEAPTKKITDFIRQPFETKIHDFFVKEIDGLLKNYEPGEPKMKPDVLAQIKQIDIQRKKMEEEARAQQMRASQQGGGQPGLPNQGFPQIMVEVPGQQPRALSPQEIVDAMKQQQDQIKQLLGRVSELEGQLIQMQQFVINGQNNSIVGPNGIENASSDYRTLPSNPTVLFKPK